MLMRTQSLPLHGPRSCLAAQSADKFKHMHCSCSSLVASGGSQPATSDVRQHGSSADGGHHELAGNNYGRPEGQNVRSDVLRSDLMQPARSVLAARQSVYNKGPESRNLLARMRSLEHIIRHEQISLSHRWCGFNHVASVLRSQRSSVWPPLCSRCAAVRLTFVVSTRIVRL